MCFGNTNGSTARKLAVVFPLISFPHPLQNRAAAPFYVPVRDADGNIHYGKVRKLMPIECWRLQGFSDEQFNKAAATGLSDTQLYKMAGNAVTVPVISALGEKIKGDPARIKYGTKAHFFFVL